VRCAPPRKPKVVPVRRRRSDTRNIAIANAIIRHDHRPYDPQLEHNAFRGRRPAHQSDGTSVPISVAARAVSTAIFTLEQGWRRSSRHP
jgi:hypothetical protein